MEIYRIKELSFTFPGQEKPALRGLDLSVESGQLITIAGRSGCGKSTLLRHLKSVLTPHGARGGEILYRGRPLAEADLRTQASEIGFVLQNPDNQIVTDKVWHELAFGLESLGLDQRTIRLRTAEMASFFGIQSWFHQEVTELSGGQKQLLNLASIMAMHPSVLILDEPTSQLDPIASAEFLDTLAKINRELGTTILLSEHRLEDALPLSDRLIVLDEGAVLADDTPRAAGEALRRIGHPMFASMPAPMRIHAAARQMEGEQAPAQIPLTIKEGRQWLEDARNPSPAAVVPTGPKRSVARVTEAPVAVQFKDVWFKYEQHGPDIIKDLSFDVRKGQFFCMVGGNGTGKSTTLSLLSGIRKPYRGKVLVEGKAPASLKARELFRGRLGVLPQNPQTLFVRKTVEDDLYEMLMDTGMTNAQMQAKVAEVTAFAELEELLAMHPYDLSGGEQQRAALAKVLLLEPTILVLDEPTKGLDAFFKAKLGGFLRRLNAEGVTIILVSHDIEFCAEYGETCAMFFDGGIIASSESKAFFAGNHFYTTAANRMARRIWPDAVTTASVIERCGGGQ